MQWICLPYHIRKLCDKPGAQQLGKKALLNLMWKADQVWSGTSSNIQGSRAAVVEGVACKGPVCLKDLQNLAQFEDEQRTLTDESGFLWHVVNSGSEGSRSD